MAGRVTPDLRCPNPRQLGLPAPRTQPVGVQVAPRPRLERGTYCLGIDIKTFPDDVGYDMIMTWTSGRLTRLGVARSPMVVGSPFGSPGRSVRPPVPPGSKAGTQHFALGRVGRAHHLPVVLQPCDVQPGSASRSARSDDRCRYSIGSTRRSFGRPADSFERITSARSATTTSSLPTRRRWALTAS